MTGPPKPNAAGALRIGCSGWIYPHWKGQFYPEGLRTKDRLAYYASQFDTVEINASFYRLPSEAAVQGWARQAPPGFLYAWKASKYVTHAKRLKEVSESVALVYDRMAPLGDKLGPVLFQLPPQMKPNLERLADFLRELPKTPPPAIEFRHPGWHGEETFALLREHDVALCVSDHHHAPAPWIATAGHVYVRGHGPGGRYFGRYPSAELDRWADHIGGWLKEGRDVHAYFDNDIGGAAPIDAAELKAKLAVGPNT